MIRCNSFGSSIESGITVDAQLSVPHPSTGSGCWPEPAACCHLEQNIALCILSSVEGCTVTDTYVLRLHTTEAAKPKAKGSWLFWLPLAVIIVSILTLWIVFQPADRELWHLLDALEGQIFAPK